MRFVGLLICSLAILLSASSDGFAQTRRALLVGINNYRNVDKLQKAVGDVQAMKSALEKLGFTVDLLTDPDRLTLNLGVSNFAGKIQKGDVAFVQFSGHGVALDGENYLLPVDIPKPGTGDKEVLKSESLALTSLLERVRKPGPGAAIFVIDACRDNPFANAGTRSIGTRGGLANVEAGSGPGGAFIMYSAGYGQTAVDRLSDNDPEPTSIYTRTLLRKISVEGKPITDIAREVREDVEVMAASINHEQRPAYYDEMSGPVFYFVPPRPQAAGADTQAVEVAFWNSISNSRNAILYRDYLAKFGDRGNFASLAKSRIAELEPAAPVSALPPVSGKVADASAAVIATPVEVAVTSASFQPSFDCKQNQNAIEQLICGDAGLASRDRILASLFYKTIDGLSDDGRKSLRGAQRDWLARRNACAKLPREQTAGCVTQLYESRIAELRGAPVAVASLMSQPGAATRAVGPPSFDCNGNLNAVESAICADGRLSGMDRSLADLYKRALQASDSFSRQQLLDAQRAWIRTRGQCQNPNIAGCIARVYDQRIGELMAVVGKR